MKFLHKAGVCLLLFAVTMNNACSRSDHPPAASQSRTSPAVAERSLVVQEIDSPAGAESREPELFTTTDGRVLFSWVEKTGRERYALRFAARDAEGWSEPRTVAEGEHWFINWADFPSVIELADKSLAAHWLVKSGAGTYAYDVHIARSADGGKTWSQPIVPHQDKTETEHGFVSLLPLAEGRLGAVWLDGRNLKDVKDEHEDEHKPLPVNMTLRYASIDGSGRLSDETQLDGRVCECCQTAATLTSEGAIVVYRDRSDEEVRDIYFVRQQAGGWTEPQPVHTDGWGITACPVNGPSIAAAGRSVAVAWYTEAGDRPRVQLAFSGDAGATFAKPLQVDDGNPIGRVDLLLLDDGSALVCWLSGTAEGGAIKARRVATDGTLGAVSIIAESNIARSSGFPRLARHGSEILFAWTQFGKPSRVRTARVSFK